MIGNIDKSKVDPIRKFNDAGFSLLEMLTVVAIIGILSAIIAPSWVNFVQRQRVNKANDAVLAAIKQAQTEAKKQKINYSVSFRVNSATDIPEYIVYQGTPPATITNTTRPSSSTEANSGWLPLGDTLGLKSRQVFLYTNLSSLTAYNTRVSTSDSNIVTNATGTGTITFDYLGTLANKNTTTVADTPLKVMVALPQPTGSTPTDLKRCMIIEGLIAGMRTAQDTACE
jgi:prepilin-type N-terminal cleavage/methylation domain-containing protein